MSDLADMGLMLRPVHRDASDRTAAVDAALRCDVALISDDGTPAEQLIATEIARTECPGARRLLTDVFDRLSGEYDSGRFAPHPAWIVRLIRQGAAACGVSPLAIRLDALLPFFDRVNRALFAAQTVGWLAGGDLNVHLYGDGWDRHEKFAPLYRGPAAGDAMRRAVWRASRINLALGPYGAVTREVTDGIAAGGFVLFRYCPADVIERCFPPIYDFCLEQKNQTNGRLDILATPGIRTIVALASRTLGIDVLTEWSDFVPHVLATGAAGRTTSAAAIWPDYPSLAFGTRDALLGLASKFLYDVPERQRLADALRRDLHARQHHVKVAVSRAFVARAREVAA